MWATKKITRDIKYSYVDGDDKESLVPRRSSDDSDLTLPNLSETRHRSRWPYVTGNTTGIVALVLVYGLSIFAAVLGTCAVQNRGNNLLKKTSAYCKCHSCLCKGCDDSFGIAPVFDKVHIPLIKTKIDATLFPDPANPNHIYRLPPSPEVDAAWERISRKSSSPSSLTQSI